MCAFLLMAPAFLIGKDSKVPPNIPTDALAVLEVHCVKCHGGENTKQQRSPARQTWCRATKH